MECRSWSNSSTTISERFAMLICIALSFFASSHSAMAQENDIFLKKPARSDFDMKEFRDFISTDLSRPISSGSFAIWGFETRKVYGQIVDHNGKPVSNAQVAIAEPIGYSDRCYDENFDKTDGLGRFVVEGHVRRSRLAFWRKSGQVLGVDLKPDQETIKIVWPKPANLKIQIDSKLCDAECDVMISSTSYWVGMHPLRYMTKLDPSYRTSVENLMPGEYSINVGRSINVGEEKKTHFVEVGTVSPQEGENKTLQCDTVGHAQIIGNVKNAKYLTVYRQKNGYHDISRTVAFVAMKGDGTFDPIQLETGRYVFRFHALAAARHDGGMRGFGIGTTETLLRKQRVVVTDDDMQIDLNSKEGGGGTIAQAYAILDSEPSTRATWSHADVQAAAIHGIEERDAVVNELLNLLNDPDCPHPWEHVILETFDTMADNPKVVDGLLSVLENPVRAWSRPAIIGVLQNAKHSEAKIVDGIAKHRSSDNIVLRSVCLEALGKIAETSPDRHTAIAPILIEALNDRDDQIRSRAAATLGRIKSNAAVKKLYELRDDPSGKVAVWSAFAIWQISGAREQVIEVLTARLNGETYNGKWDAVYLLSEFDNPDPETINSLVRLTDFESKAPFTAEKMERSRLKSQAESTLKKIATNR